MIIDREALPKSVTLPEPVVLDINPNSQAFKQVAPHCNETNPSTCLVATLGYVQLGRRVTLTFRHTFDGAASPTLRVSLGGGYSATKAVPPDVLDVAERFDRGVKIRKRVQMAMDLDDGTWVFHYRKSTGGVKTPTNNDGRGTQNARIKNVRARSLAQVRKELVAA